MNLLVGSKVFTLGNRWNLMPGEVPVLLSFKQKSLPEVLIRILIQVLTSLTESTRWVIVGKGPISGRAVITELVEKFKERFRFPVIIEFSGKKIRTANPRGTTGLLFLSHLRTWEMMYFKAVYFHFQENGHKQLEVSWRKIIFLSCWSWFQHWRWKLLAQWPASLVWSVTAPIT